MQYPDTGDALTCALIETEFDGAYWQHSEQRVLQIACTAVQQLPRPRAMVDFGCGQGRLLPVFAPYVDTLTALEPDPTRCAHARRAAAALGSGVQVREGDQHSLKTGAYDVLLCSHVLQHLPGPVAAEILTALWRAARPGALLLLATTHIAATQDAYTVEQFEGGRRTVRPIAQADFDAWQPQPGVLPVRYFARRTIAGELAAHGFTLQQTAYYHYDRTVNAHMDVAADEAYNARHTGAGARDVLYLAQKEQADGAAN